LANAVLRFGFNAITTVIWQDVAVSISTATGVGLMLSLVGVLYPAILAARMQPVEAMRAEH
jgi:ABC-type antimicrobial peptide transport system permease subunit